MFKHLRALGLACFILAIPGLLRATEKLTILHLNDTHGQIEPIQAKDGSEYGGFARVAYVVDSLRAEAGDEGRTVFFLHGGDALQGPPISNMSKGELDFELFNEMGLTAMVVGNHEFDFGQKNLSGLIGIAEFPLISANVWYESGKSAFQQYVEAKVGKQRVLIIGLTTRHTPVGTHPDNVRGLTFTWPDTAAALVLDEQGYGEGDLIIALTHLGHLADSALVEHVPEIDLIVGGHSHYYTEEPLQVNDALIVQAGARTVFLGKLEADVKKGELKDWEYELILLSDSLPEDPEIAAQIAAASKEVDEQLDVPIGKTEVALVPGFAEADDERSLGDLLARIMQEETGADFAFTNAGGVRATILPGDITMKDVLTALPFANTIVTMGLTAAQVQELLDYNVSLGGQSGGTLHLAGVIYEVKDSSAVNIRIGGSPLEPAKTYRIATNNFLAAGGDGYEMLKQGSDIYDTGTGLNSMLVGYIERMETITKPLDQK